MNKSNTTQLQNIFLCFYWIQHLNVTSQVKKIKNKYWNLITGWVCFRSNNLNQTFPIDANQTSTMASMNFGPLLFPKLFNFHNYVWYKSLSYSHAIESILEQLKYQLKWDRSLKNQNWIDSQPKKSKWNQNREVLATTMPALMIMYCLFSVYHFSL